MKTSNDLRRRTFLKTVAGAGLVAGLQPLGLSFQGKAWGQEGKLARSKIPVILASDIGDDIDDTWALGFLLKSPELDLKLVVGEYGKPQYRAKLLAKFLQSVHHGHVPIGIGMDTEPRGDGPQGAWVKDYDLRSYPGKVHQDGVQAIIDTIMHSRQKVTIISIGPMPNVAAALAREPRIANQARLVGMYGSVRRGYDGSPQISAEWNVKADPKACQKAFTMPWDITITPLDTCGRIILDGERYQRIRDSKDPVAGTVIENYRLWSKTNNAQDKAADHHSSTLFDTVAVYLSFAQDLCQMERLGLRVTEDGFTRIDQSAKVINVATEWRNLDGFRDLLTARLTGAK